PGLEFDYADDFTAGLESVIRTSAHGAVWPRARHDVVVSVAEPGGEWLGVGRRADRANPDDHRCLARPQCLGAGPGGGPGEDRWSDTGGRPGEQRVFSWRHLRSGRHALQPPDLQSVLQL